MLAANQLMGFEAFGRGCYKLQLASLCRELVQGQLVMIVELSRHVRYVSFMSFVYTYTFFWHFPVQLFLQTSVTPGSGTFLTWQ